MKAIFFGDAHLNDRTIKELNYLTRFMDDVLVDADLVFILGDIFEFYYGYDGFVYSWFLPFVQKLKELSAKNKKLFFLEGNHEFCMGSYFQKLTSCECFEKLDITLDNIRVFVSHGHKLGFSVLNSVLKSKIVLSLMDLLGPKVAWKVANFASLFLSKKEKSFKEKNLRLFRQYAEKKLKEGFDVVILAHSHIPDAYEIVQQDKRKLYFNTGDIIRNSTYVEYTTQKGFSLMKYS